MKSDWEKPVTMELPYRALFDVFLAAKELVDHGHGPEDIHPERIKMFRESLREFEEEVYAVQPKHIGPDRWPQSMKEAWDKTVLEMLSEMD